jgi:hypothetical protein
VPRHIYQELLVIWTVGVAYSFPSSEAGRRSVTPKYPVIVQSTKGSHIDASKSTRVAPATASIIIGADIETGHSLKSGSGCFTTWSTSQCVNSLVGEQPRFRAA